MERRRRNFRDLIGLLAGTATALQGYGLAQQLYLACTETTAGLALSLFLQIAAGGALWAIWGFTKPGRPELIVAIPNTANAVMALLVCIAIALSPLARVPQESTATQNSTEVTAEDDSFAGK